MHDRLLKWASERGYLVAWGPAELAIAAQEEVTRLATSGVLEGKFYATELGSTAHNQNARTEGLATVVVVAKPRPAHVVEFAAGGEVIEAVFPPTYVRYRPLFEEVAADLGANALPGVRIERLMAPLKPLAVRLGLVRYGRNNVTYAPGFGSFIQLLGYLTDAVLPLPEGWRPQELALLPECETCGVCRAICPTGAIDEDRVLLHAEHCLTYANENAGPWPSWVPSTVHNCLVGCLVCQRACPANTEMPLERSGVIFGDEETRALLADTGEHVGEVWDRIRARLTTLGQPYSEPVVGRNLLALVEASGRGAGKHAGG